MTFDDFIFKHFNDKYPDEMEKVIQTFDKSKEKKMKLIPVKSSNIKAVAHDPSTEILTINFKSGGTYEYSKVPKKVYTAFVASDSLGKFFFKKIRNVYKTKKV